MAFYRAIGWRRRGILRIPRRPVKEKSKSLSAHRKRLRCWASRYTAPMWIAWFLSLLTVAACAPPPGRPAFDAERAYADVVAQVGFGARTPGSDGHRACAAWLEATLRELADEVAVDRFESAGLPLINVVARFRPEERSRVLLASHWDSRPHADQDRDPARRLDPVPGANDGASSTAVLLELARMFHASRPEVGIDLVFFDGEDYGDFSRGYREVLLGSQRYAKTFEGPRPRFGILLDMIGDGDLRLPQEVNSWSCCRQTVEKVWRVAAELGHGDVFLPQRGSAVVDDHLPLNEVGLGVIDIIDIEYPWWHTTGDLPERVSAKSLGIVGDVVAEVVYRERVKP